MKDEKIYEVALEIAGPMAQFTRPDSGNSFVSYPVPTFAAAAGIFRNVAWWKDVYIEPIRVEICTPVKFMRLTQNYHGPFKKPGNNNFQLSMLALVDVCYKLYGRTRRLGDGFTPGYNPLHALQEQFSRRLKQGKLFRTPCLGLSECTPSYFGPLRDSTFAQKDINLTISSMLFRTFNDAGEYAPEFRQNVKIKDGVLIYA